MDSKFFYIYLMLVIVATFSFTIIRCVFKRNELDIFFYPNEANNIIANKVYLVAHIFVCFTFGCCVLFVSNTKPNMPVGAAGVGDAKVPGLPPLGKAKKAPTAVIRPAAAKARAR